MKRLALLTSFFVLIALGSAASAELPPPSNDLTAVITLDNLTAKGLPKGSQDQFYMAITEFKDGGKTELNRIPKYPYALVMKQDSKITPTKLWENNLKKGESTILLFQLVEQKLSPKGADDIVGVAKLEINNQNGHLRSKWVIPGSDKVPLRTVAKNGERDTFTVKRKKGEYKVVLGLTASYNS